jgi:hypothetical protein
MGSDVVIPIVFPDYLIAVNTPNIAVKVPDLIPVFDVFPDVVHIPATQNKIPYLGHAGVLFINGAVGTTKYFEYGRYDRANLGLTRRIPISDVVIGADGNPTAQSLKSTLGQISEQAGKGGRILATYIKVPGQYSAMLKYVTTRVLQNSNPKRKPYDLTSNSCMHFSKSVVEAGGKKAPAIHDPRPVNFIEEMRNLYTPLDFIPPGRLLIGGAERAK